METWQSLLLFLLPLSSYPTYEEWKPGLEQLKSYCNAEGSYPTYEEWKPGAVCYVYRKDWKFLSYL